MKDLMKDPELRYILRQIGFGCALGAAFLMFVYIGGLIAHLISGI